MPVGMLIQLPGATAEFYDSVMEHLDWDTIERPQGFISHYAGPTGDGWLVFDVWETQADFERFVAERLGAALAAASGGTPPEIAPTFVPIHREDHARTTARV